MANEYNPFKENVPVLLSHFVGRERIGRYEIKEEIERRSTSTICRAYDPNFDRPVALKVFHPGPPTQCEKLREHFEREIMAARRLTHPNIVNVYDADEDEGLEFIVTENYLEGHSLDRVIKAEGSLPTERVIDIALQICDALDHAHQRGVVHRNIKPNNIILLENDRVKIIDFDLAKLISVPDVSQPGEFQGTCSYSSPEQIAGWPIDGRSDIFSLGIVIYKMLTGEKPFQSGSIPYLVYQILKAPPSLKGLTPHAAAGLKDILFKAMAKDVNKRYQTCAELAHDLRRLRPSIAKFSDADRAWQFFELAGFDIEKISDTVYRVKSGKPEWKEYGEMLVRCLENDDVRGENIAEVASASLERAGDGKKMAFIVHSGRLIEGAACQLWEYKTRQGLVIIPIHATTLRDQLMDSERNPDACREALLRLEEKWSTLGNPYESIDARTDPQWFFGPKRRKATEEMLQQIDEGVKAAVVHGMCTVGKSAFINQIYRDCRSRGHLTAKWVGKPYSGPCHEILNDIKQELILSLKALYPGLKVPDLSVFTRRYDANTFPTFKQDLLQVAKALDRHTGKAAKIVILLDEVDWIFPRQESSDEEYLSYCNLFQTIEEVLEMPDKPSLLSLVVAIESLVINRVDMFPHNERFRNPMFDRFKAFKRLLCMEREDLDDMIETIGQLRGLEYSRDSLDRIFEQTRGHVVLARKLCSCIVALREKPGGNVRMKDVVKAEECLLAKEFEYFLRYLWDSPWSDDPEAEQLILLELASSPRLEEELLFKDDSTQMRQQIYYALHRLEDLGLIEKSEQDNRLYYNLTIPIYQRWIKDYLPDVEKPGGW